MGDVVSLYSMICRDRSGVLTVSSLSGLFEWMSLEGVLTRCVKRVCEQGMLRVCV